MPMDARFGAVASDATNQPMRYLQRITGLKA